LLHERVVQAFFQNAFAHHAGGTGEDDFHIDITCMRIRESDSHLRETTR
jgi:hypothetical protein